MNYATQHRNKLTDPSPLVAFVPPVPSKKSHQRNPNSRPCCRFSPLGTRHDGEYDRRGVLALLLSIRHGMSAEKAGFLAGTQATSHEQTEAEREVAIRKFYYEVINAQ